MTDLELFTRAVICGNKNLAAENIGLPLEDILERIDKLEQELGFELLDREQQRFTLTAEGQKFYESIIDKLEKLMGEK